MKRYLHPAYVFPAGMVATGCVLIFSGYAKLAPRYFALALLAVLVIRWLRRVS